MTAERIAAIIQQRGETLTLRRITGTASPTNTDVAVKGMVRQYRPDELTPTVIQGDSEIILSDAEITAEEWPGPPRKGDVVIRDGKHLRVQACETRNWDEDAALHVLQARG